MKYVPTSATLTLFNVCLTPVRVLRLLDTCIELCIILLFLLGWLVSILSPWNYDFNARVLYSRKTFRVLTTYVYGIYAITFLG